jgi:Domain of unknown function (DUF5916)
MHILSTQLLKKMSLQNMKWLFTLSLFVCLSFSILVAQNIVRRETKAIRTDAKIKIDGLLEEPEWQTAPANTGWVQQEPKPGLPASYPCETRFLYTDKAIYVGAVFQDPFPDSIARELTLRDEFGNDDIFCVNLDTYRSGVNSESFCVSAAGVQIDMKSFPGEFGERDDMTWSAVWASAVKITKTGWSCEFEIPYSAIRFPKADEQKWRINFGRHIRRYRETSFWNTVNPQIDGFTNQMGEITGITGIKPPVRLQAVPYLSAYAQNDYNNSLNPKSNWGRSFNAGMDIKYGINDAFTLDATLIPDFGQVQSDNKILNLSPFEVRFDENRPFFTEGLELFNKGDFFYSRRVGGIPNTLYNDLYSRLKPNESVESAPSQAQLYNASKVTGRTKKGLGVGVFNAVAAPTYATIKNTEGGRKEVLSPLTNYNIVSFDQNLPNNSYLNIINTNVLRNGTAYDANATGVTLDMKDKSNTYGFNVSSGLVQRLFTNKNDVGYQYGYQVKKISGTWRWWQWHNVKSYNYNPNDLGFLNQPNQNETGMWGSYNKFNTKRFREMRIEAFSFYTRLNRPKVWSDYAIQSEGFFLTQKIFAFGYEARFEPFDTHDYFEPRTSDFSRYLRFIRNYKLGSFISTNYAKRFAFDLGASHRIFLENKQSETQFMFSPRMRFSDKIALQWNIEATDQRNYPNFVSKDPVAVGFSSLPSNAILMGAQKQLEVTNVPSLKWNFTPLMGLNVRLRHYWTRVEYVRYHELGAKGDLLPTKYTGKDATGMSLHNANFNLFNVDANFTWRFAPGSDLILNWKQNVSGEDNNVKYGYLWNARNMFDNPMTNSFSVRVNYFLDYLNFVKTKKK